MTTFSDLGLHRHVLEAITDQGYETPTPIQLQAIPPILDKHDLLGIAQTGTGKTAAFALPTLHHLIQDYEKRKAKSCRVLVLAPTRELASQICYNFKTYSKFTDIVTQAVFGGVGIHRQIRNMNKGCHILVATPGRLVDLMNQGAICLKHTDRLILDEADQMLDMGFIHDLKKIMADLPKDRQTLLFSATMPKAISDLAAGYLADPVKVSVAPESTTAERVRQGVLHVASGDKLRVLEAVLRDQAVLRALVFTRTKHGADKVARKLIAKQIPAEAIHGNKSQPQRKKALEAFRRGHCKVLIATDIAARGIDIDGISHVINIEMPNVAEQYVHRIGRTARAGKEGLAISLVAEDELYYLQEIERITRMHIDVLATPEGCETCIRATPDANIRVRKPKLTRNKGGNRRSNGNALRAPGRSAGKLKPQKRQRKNKAKKQSIQEASRWEVEVCIYYF